MAEQWNDLNARMGAGAAMVVIGLAGIALGGHVFHVLVALICGLMVWELVGMLRPGVRHLQLQLGVVTGLAVFLSIYLPVGFALPVLLAPALIGFAYLEQNRSIYIAFTGMILLAGYGMMQVRDDLGFGWMLWLVLVVVVTDIVGYFAGRMIGGPKFWPAVSPKKTWSGTAFGWLGAGLVGLIFAIYFGVGLQLIGVSIALSMASQMGDIAESGMKRKMGVKDSSSLIPGHGGLMDRFDGMLGAALFLLVIGQFIGFPPGSWLINVVRKVSILGATGSIGQNTIDLIARAPDSYDVVALTGASNIAQLAKDAIALRADVAVTAHDHLLDELRAALAGSDVQAAAGTAAVTEAASRPADWTMSAIVGAAGLAPGIAALEQGGTLALANKESLVCAGQLVLETARQNNSRILPVDSEHSAIFQALIGEEMSAVERIIITASGGAFRDWPIEDLAHATLDQASSHPNWAMGQRITVDSASMFNKAMEIIETHEFFDVTPDQIEVLVHPQSMIHALVGFNDGALMAHVGPPDMRHAIGFALHHPQRQPLPVERLDLAAIGQFEFRAPDARRWPALRLARETMQYGGMMGAVFNAAKESALDGFIAGQIGFTQMADVVEDTLSHMNDAGGPVHAAMTLDNVLQVDHLARKAAQAVIRKRAG